MDVSNASYYIKITLVQLGTPKNIYIFKYLSLVSAIQISCPGYFKPKYSVSALVRTTGRFPPAAVHFETASSLVPDP
jgi:hypothetical protein